MKQVKEKIRKLREFLADGSCKCPKGCFQCCTKIFFNPEEKKRMDQYLKESGHNSPPNGKGGEFCEYLNGQGGCSVYPERPIICRAFGVVDDPFCVCDKAINRKSVPESNSLKAYMASPKEFNTGSKAGQDLLEAVNNCEIWAIADLLYQTIKLHSIGQITQERMRAQYFAINEKFKEKKGKDLHADNPEFLEYYNAINKND